MHFPWPLEEQEPRGVSPTAHCSAVPLRGLAALTVSLQAVAWPTAASGHGTMYWRGVRQLFYLHLEGCQGTARTGFVHTDVCDIAQPASSLVCAADE